MEYNEDLRRAADLVAAAGEILADHWATSIADSLPQKRQRQPSDSIQLHPTKKGRPDSSSPSLCADCQSLISELPSILSLEPAKLQCHEEDGIFLRDLGHIDDALLESPCPLCRLLAVSRVIPTKSNHSTSYHLRAFTMFQENHGLRQKLCPPSLLTADTPCLAVMSSESNETKLVHSQGRFLFCHSEKLLNNCILTPVPRGSQVDYAKVSMMLHDCQENHRVLCAKGTAKVVGMKLINCYRTAASPATLDIVLATTAMKYTALSYVWGAARACKSREQDDSLLPRTIIDAMTVTKELGLQYLWVDNYTIDQSNDAEKEDQIPKMNFIYHGAELVLVAAAGEDANYGLPGVGETQRIPQPMFTLNDLQIFLGDPTPKISISQSKWAARAWTFQEARLARRLLVFTDYETYFECESVHSRESHLWKLENLQSHHGPRKFLYPPFYARTGNGTATWKSSKSPLQYLLRFWNLARDYSTKEFSLNRDHHDGLRAFWGIITDFENNTKFPIYQLHGMPFCPEVSGQENEQEDIGSGKTATTASSPATSEDFLPKDTSLSSKSFIAGLIWRHVAGTLSRVSKLKSGQRIPRAKPYRRPMFPSWSWVGWGGQAIIFLSASSSADVTNFKPMLTSLSVGVCQDDRTSEKFSLLSSTFSFSAFRDARVLSFYALVLLDGQLNFDLVIDRSIVSTPNFRLGRFRSKLYLSLGPDTRSQFREIFHENMFTWVLIGEAGLGSKRRLYFMAVNAQGSAFSRAGILIVKTNLQEFEQKYKLERRWIQLV